MKITSTFSTTDGDLPDAYNPWEDGESRRTLISREWASETLTKIHTNTSFTCRETKYRKKWFWTRVFHTTKSWRLRRGSVRGLEAFLEDLNECQALGRVPKGLTVHIRDIGRWKSRCLSPLMKQGGFAAGLLPRGNEGETSKGCWTHVTDNLIQGERERKW